MVVPSLSCRILGRYERYMKMRRRWGGGSGREGEQSREAGDGCMGVDLDVIIGVNIDRHGYLSRAGLA